MQCRSDHAFTPSDGQARTHTVAVTMKSPHLLAEQGFPQGCCRASRAPPPQREAAPHQPPAAQSGHRQPPAEPALACFDQKSQNPCCIVLQELCHISRLLCSLGMDSLNAGPVQHIQRCDYAPFLCDYPGQELVSGIGTADSGDTGQ